MKAVDQTVAANGSAYRASFGRYPLSVITVMEVVRGLQRKQATRRLKALLDTITSEEILPFDEGSAELAGRIEGDLERHGQPIGRADPMIASIALVHGLELVTGNLDHYERIRRLGYGLTLRNWRA